MPSTCSKQAESLFYSYVFPESVFFFILSEPDQRRMVEIIGHLTKMRFGDQEQSKFKDTKEASICSYTCTMSFSTRMLKMDLLPEFTALFYILWSLLFTAVLSWFLQLSHVELFLFWTMCVCVCVCVVPACGGNLLQTGSTI